MSEWTRENEHDSKIYNEGFNDGIDAGIIIALNRIKNFKNSLDNLSENKLIAACDIIYDIIDKDDDNLDESI